MTDGVKVGVLFVCLGNICRSPLAKGVFQHMVRERGVADSVEIDSCGTGGWHAGGGADPRTIAVMAANGVPLEHIARQFRGPHDVDQFDYVLGMDRANLREMVRMGASQDRVMLLRSFDPLMAGKADHEMEVPDPYYGGEDGFRKVYEMVTRACEGLYTAVLKDLEARSR